MAERLLREFGVGSCSSTEASESTENRRTLADTIPGARGGSSGGRRVTVGSGRGPAIER